MEFRCRCSAADASSFAELQFLSTHSAALHDRQEAVGLQRRAADQAAVDVGLVQQALGVLGLHAAAVLDAYAVGEVACSSVFASQSRMNACTSWAWSSVALRPVPIAQTGSYAMTSRDGSSIFAGSSSSSCCSTTSSVLSASRSSSFSPTQWIEHQPAVVDRRGLLRDQLGRLVAARAGARCGR